MHFFRFLFMMVCLDSNKWQPNDNKSLAFELSPLGSSSDSSNQDTRLAKQWHWLWFDNIGLCVELINNELSYENLLNYKVWYPQRQ